MEKEKILELASKASDCSDGYFYDNNLLLCSRTNENLTELFNQFDVENKDVFTVLGSSDQLFSCYYHKAKSVDSFDKVYLTLYYYFLRKWVILYQNSTYPSYRFFEDGDAILYKLVCNIEPSSKDEAEAQIFWKNYLKKTNYKAGNYLFYLSMCSWPVPFENNLNSIKGIFEKPLSFQNINFFEDLDFDKQYDVLILSNILEYAYDKESLINARNNIEKLLRDDGIVICSYKKNRRNSYRHKKEKEVLTSNFLKFDDGFHKYYEPLLGKKIDLAYSYKKVKK